MDPQTLNQLLTLMDEQVKVMADLTALSKKKSEVLVDGNIEELDVLLRGEQALIWQMGRLEDKRFHLQMDLASQLQIHPSQLTLEKLRKSVPADLATRCDAVAERYGATAGELSQVNQLNSELIQQAMAYVDFSLQLMGAGKPTAGQVYSPQGPKPAPTGPSRRRLDDRA